MDSVQESCQESKKAYSCFCDDEKLAFLRADHAMHHIPPYKAELVNGMAYVSNKSGLNVLSFRGSTAKFTSFEAAKRIAEAWNAE